MNRRFPFFIIFLYILIFLGCNDKGKIGNSNSKNDSIRIDTTYFENGGIEQVLSITIATLKLNGKCESFYPTGALKTIKYFYNDTAMGNSFLFYENGKIKRYAYLSDNNYTPYSKDYDSITGKIIKEFGTPLVGCDIIENVKDTIDFHLSFSNYGYKQLEIEFSTDGKLYESLAPKQGKISGNLFVTGRQIIKEASHINYFIKTRCTDSLSKEKVYFDTIFVR